MNELLKRLLEAEVLTDETRAELQGAFQKQIDEAVEAARAEAKVMVTAQLNEQWISERDTLIEALDSKVSEALVEEIEELREDIERFRDLEAESAQKLVEAKELMTETLKKDIAQLIERLDSFLEEALTSELEELREDIDQVKQQQLGKKIFESFVAEFKQYYVEDNSAEAKLVEAEQRLEDTSSALEEAERTIAKMVRESKMKEVLAPLSGRTREIMEAILKTVETQQLEEAYKTYVGRVLKESSKEDSATSEKEDGVLAEGKDKQTVSGVTKTGDRVDQLVEEQTINKQEKATKSALSPEDRDRLRKLAGF